MVVVTVAVFVVVILVLWKVAKASARMHRRASRSGGQRYRVQRYHGYDDPYGGGQEMTNIINVYPGPGRDQDDHGVREQVYSPYDMGYPSPRE